MARTAGRSNWVAWPVGLICVFVVAALAWLSVPMVPGAITWIGDALRGPTSSPVAGPVAPEGEGGAETATCRSLYTPALWAELRARTGGDPVQDAAAPPVSAVSVLAALSPAVRATCTWTAASTGVIVTTLADVGDGAAGIAEAALAAQGFSCDAVSGGTACTKTVGAVTEDITVRGGVWLSSRLDAWHPDLYTSRITARLW